MCQNENVNKTTDQRFFLSVPRRSYVLRVSAMMLVCSAVVALLLLLSEAKVNSYDTKSLQTRRSRELQVRAPRIGNQKVLVLLIDIVPNRPKPPKEHYELLFNGPDNENMDITPTGSVKTYFSENSYGLYNLDFYVQDWVQPGKTEAECAGSNQGLHGGFVDCFTSALQLLEDQFFSWLEFDENNDGFIDNLIVLHNGYNGEYGEPDEDGTPPSQRIRSHAGASPIGADEWYSTFCGTSVGYFATTSAYRGFAGANIARFNVVMHEFLHTLNMIDLYDIDFVGNGCGGYDLMSYPVGQANDITNPANIGPWTKIFMGWLEPIEITADGTYTAEASLTSNQIYKVSKGLEEGEYFLIENKHATGWDVNMWGGGGVVIW